MWPGVAYFYARFVQGSGLWWHVVEIGGLKVEGFVVYSFGAQLADQPQPGHNHHWRVLQVDASAAEFCARTRRHQRTEPPSSFLICVSSEWPSCCLFLAIVNSGQMGLVPIVGVCQAPSGS